EAITRPCFKSIPSLALIGRLAFFMIFTPDDQEIAVLRHRLQPDVVVVLERVPVQGSMDRASRNSAADRVAEVGRLLRVNGYQIVDRRVGGDDYGISRHYGAAFRLDLCGWSSVDSRRVRSRVDSSSLFFRGPRQPSEVLKRMELTLATEAKRPAGVERLQR